MTRLRGKDIFKILVKITPPAIVIHGADFVFRPVGQRMPAGSVLAVPVSQGFLPGDVFAGVCSFSHGVIIFAIGAVVKIVTVFLVCNVCLHPDTGMICFLFSGFPYVCGFFRSH